MNIIESAMHAVTDSMSNLWPQQPDHQPKLVEGELRSCPPTMNCVGSENSHALAKIAPFAFTGEPEKAWLSLKQAIIELGGKIESEEDAFLWATFVVPVLGFIDDVECRMDRSSGLIHVRSAARLGLFDFGVNRMRVEQLRMVFTRLL